MWFYTHTHTHTLSLSLQMPYVCINNRNKMNAAEVWYRRKLKTFLVYKSLMIERHYVWTTDVNVRKWKYIEIA